MTRRSPTRTLSVTLASALAAVMLPACTTVEPAAGTAPAGRAEAPRKVVQGSVLYRDKAELPPDAQVKVQLVEMNPRSQDVVAETTFGSAGRQVPLPFSLPLDESKLKPDRAYALRAYISYGGATRYVTGSRVNVEPHALPAAISILLIPGSGDAPITDSPAPPGATRQGAPPSGMPRGAPPVRPR